MENINLNLKEEKRELKLISIGENIDLLNDELLNEEAFEKWKQDTKDNNNLLSDNDLIDFITENLSKKK